MCVYTCHIRMSSQRKSICIQYDRGAHPHLSYTYIHTYTHTHMHMYICIHLSIFFLPVWFGSETSELQWRQQKFLQAFATCGFCLALHSLPPLTRFHAQLAYGCSKASVQQNLSICYVVVRCKLNRNSVGFT